MHQGSPIVNLRCGIPRCRNRGDEHRNSDDALSAAVEPGQRSHRVCSQMKLKWRGGLPFLSCHILTVGCWFCSKLPTHDTVKVPLILPLHQYRVGQAPHLGAVLRQGADIFFRRQISLARGQISARSASHAKSSPLLRGLHSAARSAVQPRVWSDINGSGRGTAGTVG